MIAAIKYDIRSRPGRWGAVFIALLLMIDILSVAMWMSFSPQKIQKTSASGSSSATDPGVGISEFLSKLRAAGAEPSFISGHNVKREPLSISGDLVTFNGDNVQVFEYSSPAAALKDAQKFSGLKGTDKIYIEGSVLVVYTGNREEIMSLLSKALELPFASESGSV